MVAILLPLIKANISVLAQKIAFLDLLAARQGKQAAADFQAICPVVGASIGQHYRHSMDHIEMVAHIASYTSKGESGRDDTQELHYDRRVRGGAFERDMMESRKRIISVVNIFQTLGTVENNDSTLASYPITSYFNLSSESNSEIGLPSTVGRELGFAAHHAIHHMAMVKVIALKTLGFDESDLPNGFGRANSTILFDNQQI